MEPQERPFHVLAENGECLYLGEPKGLDVIGDRRFQCRKLDKLVSLADCGCCSSFKAIAQAKGGPSLFISSSQRQEITVDRTRRSIGEAFGISPAVFSDADSPSGPWAGFWVTVTMAYTYHPHATYYGYFQDDVLLDITARARLEALLTHLEGDKTPQVISFYIPTVNVFEEHLGIGKAADIKTSWEHAPRKTIEFDVAETRIGDTGAKIVESHKWHRVDMGYACAGACTFIFTPTALRDLLSDATVLRHRWRGDHDGWRQVDQVVGAWASKWGGIWYPDAPLASHIGRTSSKFKYNPGGILPPWAIKDVEVKAD